jgi:hypothetical protein
VSQLCTTWSKLEGKLLGAKTPKPRLLDHAAAGGRRVLLVLAGKIIFAEARADPAQRLQGFSLGMQRLAGPSFERPASERRLDDMPFVGLGDRGKREDVPAFSSQDVADEIVFVQPLHDDDDYALGFVV